MQLLEIFVPSDQGIRISDDTKNMLSFKDLGQRRACGSQIDHVQRKACSR